jgi:hypothetical protein
MILSDRGIKQAIAKGHIVIDPTPPEDHYQTSAVDIVLGESFKVWNLSILKETPGFTGHLDLSQQKFAVTAMRFAKDADKDSNGCVVLPP